MSAHEYRITVEPLPREGRPTGEPLVFETACHDDLLAIADRLKSDPRFGPKVAPPLAVGLKLLGEVLLAHRNEEPFAAMADHFGKIMRTVKQGSRG